MINKRSVVTYTASILLTTGLEQFEVWDSIFLFCFSDIYNSRELLPEVL